MKTNTWNPSQGRWGDPGSLIDLASGRLSSVDSLHSIEYLETDIEASMRLELIVDLMQLATEVKDNIFEANSQIKVRRSHSLLNKLSELTKTRVILQPIGGLLSILLGIVFLMAISSAERNKYDELVGIGRTAFDWNVRGPSEGDLAASYNLFTQGKYSEVALHLERFLRTHPLGETGWYVRYCLGTVYLLSSRKSYIHFYTTYDIASVQSGLAELDRSARGTQSLRLKEEARLLRSKGFLILGLPDSAIAELNLVQQLEGPRKSEALQMIDRIKTLANGDK